MNRISDMYFGREGGGGGGEGEICGTKRVKYSFWLMVLEGVWRERSEVIVKCALRERVLEEGGGGRRI